MFEASVGGGIPIIRPLNSCLTADEIEEITGIVNGTTNYMMTEMSEKGADFDEVLKDAQAKGYAEKDPTADIEGYDACRKIAILTSLVCGQQVDFEDIHTEGITHISATDIKYAKAMEEQSNFLLRAKNRWRICGNGSTVLTAERAPVIQCKRRIQCNFCSWKCTWGCNVLRKRCRKTSDSQCGCSRCCGDGKEC